MVGVTPWLLVYPIPLLPVEGHVHANLDATLEMELCACVCILTPCNNNKQHCFNIALDPCIAASNGGCDPNAYCIMTGPGQVCTQCET